MNIGMGKGIGHCCIPDYRYFPSFHVGREYASDGLTITIVLRQVSELKPIITTQISESQEQKNLTVMRKKQ